jgi:hypothetical protein
MADTAATDIPAETDDEPTLTLAQADELLAALRTFGGIPWAVLLADELAWVVERARVSGTICECGFTIVPPEKT